ILVIDNHSNLDCESLKKEWPQVRVLVSERNLGFGLANNVASAYSSARYFFFLNNDCVLLNDAASILFRWMELHPSAGLSGAQLVSPGGRPIVSFDYFPTLATKFVGVAPLRALGAGRFPRKDGSVRSATEVDVVTGAALFVRAETFRSLGGFDARLFLYCEEEDLAKRMWDAGHAVWFVPEAAIEHAGGGSSFNKTALRKEFYISFFLFYRKHYGAARTRAIQAFTIVQVSWRLLWRGERDLWK